MLLSDISGGLPRDLVPASQLKISPNLMIKPGERQDNIFLQYSHQNLPSCAANFDAPRYIHKNYVGYYAWPLEECVYAPSCDQPRLDRTPEELSASELVIHSFFSEPTKVTKLLSFLTLEEKKGKDRFNVERFLMFKALFRNFGDSFVCQFRSVIEERVGEKRESFQRVAAELVAALVRGSKHWPFHKTEQLWSWVIPAIRTALGNVAPETV